MKFTNYVLTAAMLLTSYTAAFSQPTSFIEFNGTDQYAEIPSHEDFNIDANESFSITCWVSLDQLVEGQNSRFVSRRLMNETTQTTGYEMWGANNSTQFYAVNTPKPSSGNIYSQWCTGNYTAGSWVHLALVINRADNTVTIYHDGIQGGQGESADLSSWTVVNTNKVYLGGAYSVSDNGMVNLMDGKLANVRFWSKALTAAEVAADMNATVGPDTEALIAAYDFANISGLTVPDISGHGHDATLSGFDPVGSDVAIYSATSKADTNFTGRGNTNEIASSMAVAITGQEGTYTFRNLSLDLTGTTNVQDITSIKVYMTDQNSFDPRKASEAQLLGTCTPTENTVACELTGSSPVGTKYLWVTFDVAETAAEGNRIAIKPTMLDEKAVSTITTGSREILLNRTLLFAPGDYESFGYRIPAIITSWDGSLVAVSDKRKYNQNDIPEDIDIVVRRSTDNGKTWSEPVTMARGTGYKQGYGDAAIVKTNTENELLCIFIGGNGLFASTTSDRIKTYISRSTDNGQSWSAPEEITDQLFSGERASWTASFCAAGNGLKTRNGVLMFVAAMRHDSGRTLYNHVVYSNDNGKTWHVSNSAMEGGDEAKVVELNDGHILMSIRRQSGGARFYTISENVPSTTEAVRWTQKTTSTASSWAEMVEPACNGDIVRYTSTLDGYDKDRILHTVPNHASARQNVSLFLSYDEGNTWPVQKSLCPTASAYSSIAILKDGTIGVYLEENYNTDKYSLYFLNVSLDWLTDHADTYVTPGIAAVAAPVFSVPAGHYTEAQTLEITTTTEDAQIYYTLDGATPTTESTLYVEPITLDQTVTVKAIAVKEGMSNSVMTSAEYTFQTEWEQPTGTIHPDEARYVTSATTTGAVEDLNYTLSSKPSTVFIDTQSAFTVEAGQEFTLRVQCTEQMIWCHAVLFADWNRDFDFDDEGEMITKVGIDSYELEPGDNTLSDNGNTMMKDFSVDITVPADAKVAETRLRIQFSDAWHNKSAHEHTAMDNIDKGGCYDFVMNIEPSSDQPSGIDGDRTAHTMVYPTLFTEGVTLVAAGDGEARIFDLAGRLLSRVEVSEGENYIDATALPAGSLIMVVTTAEGTKSFRVVKK